MGKNLKGKEIGKGLCQRKDGLTRRNIATDDSHLYKLCDEAGIKRFSMHVLRHTYATRAIERGVQPKVLQKLLGHASIQTTMDRYVHMTDDALHGAIKKFEENALPKTDTIMVKYRTFKVKKTCKIKEKYKK